MDAWQWELAGDPNEHFLLHGIENEFKIVDAGSVVAPVTVDNHKSVADQADLVASYT